MKILITGATGCLGRRIVQKLFQDGHTVIALVRRKGDARSVDPSLEELLWTDPISVNQKTAQGASVAIHCAATTPSTGKDFSKNAAITREFLGLCSRIGVKQFIHISSSGVLGENFIGERTDSDEPRPDTAYGESKWQCEKWVVEECQRQGMSYTILRPGLIYGPHDRGGIYQIIRMIDRGFFVRLGSGNNKKSMVSVENVAETARLCLTNEKARNETMIVVDDRLYTMNDILNEVALALGRRPRTIAIPLWIVHVTTTLMRVVNTVLPLPIRPADINKLISDNYFSAQKLKTLLPGSIGDHFRQTLREEVDWYRETHDASRLIGTDSLLSSAE